MDTRLSTINPPDYSPTLFPYLPPHSLTMTAEEIKQVCRSMKEQAEKLENFILYARGHREITSLKNASTQGCDRYHHALKPDFSAALKELDHEYLMELKNYLETRANKTSYVSIHTLTENISLTGASLCLAYCVSSVYIPVLIGKIVYDQYQHEQLVQTRVNWLLQDIFNILNTINRPATLQNYSIFQSNPTAPPITVEEAREWPQLGKISQGSTFSKTTTGV